MLDNPEPNMKIIETRLNHIDVAGNSCTAVDMTGDLSDLEGYLVELLSEIGERKEKRSYDFERSTTEFATALAKFGVTKSLESSVSESLAARLLSHESKTEEKYSHLKTGDSLVKKGSFLQFLYQNEGNLAYLGVKMEHAAIVDEVDFKKRWGLPDASKIYKACRVLYDESHNPRSVHAYDTNSQPSVYWWREFLELKVLKDDSHNTLTAVNAVLSTVARIRNKFPHHHTVLKNTVIGAFKKDGQMNFHEFIDKTIAPMFSDEPEFQKEMPKLLEKLRQLPEKEKFDTQFTLIPAVVKFRRTKVELTPEISLSYDSDMEDIDKKIWAEKTSDGVKLVVIRSDSAYDQFKTKERS